MVDNAINDSKAFGFDLPLDEISTTMSEYRYLLDEIRIPRLVNNDLFGNIMLSRESHEIIGIVDFERCYYADPYVDFISSSMLFENIETAFIFKRGYESYFGRTLTITNNDRIRMILYRLLKALTQYNESHRYEGEYRLQVQT